MPLDGLSEGERAKRLENPDLKRPIEATAERFARLADRFERERKKA
jgi:hypothetical protein